MHFSTGKATINNLQINYLFNERFFIITAYLGLSNICKFIQGPINSVNVFREYFLLNILPLKLGLVLYPFPILLQTGKHCFDCL